MASDFQLGKCETKRYKILEMWHGSPAPADVPAWWDTTAPANLTVTPVGANPSMEADVTGKVVGSGAVVRANIDGGPAFSATFDVVIKVDGGSIAPE